jgi:hypothetical protein
LEVASDASVLAEGVQVESPQWMDGVRLAVEEAD